jgi:hypothetical protein
LFFRGCVLYDSCRFWAAFIAVVVYVIGLKRHQYLVAHGIVSRIYAPSLPKIVTTGHSDPQITS